MAISVENNGLVIRCEGHSDYETASLYIRALLGLLMSVTENNRLSTEDAYYVCDLIRELLPSHREFFRLGQAAELAAAE